MNWEGQERRKFPRAVFPCKIILSSPVRLFSSHTENISEGGIRVILEDKLELFTTVGLEIFLEKDRPIKCKGRVVWIIEKVNPLKRECLMFDIGIKFTEISNQDREYIRDLVTAIISQGKEEKKE